MRRPCRLRTIPAMIRDQSAKKPAKGAPKKAAPKNEKAAPENKKAAPKKIAKALAGTKERHHRCPKLPP
ncbi:hypothetical protein ACVWZK_007687 [Bradyrhizobium sp. GM0.4]